MLTKKFVTLVTALSLTFSLAASGAVSAAEGSASAAISEEKLKVMMAAGEIIPNSTKGEETAKISKDKAVELARECLDDPSRYETGNIFYNQNWGFNRSSWNVDFYVKQAPGGNANVAVDAQTGEIINYNSWDNYDYQQNHIAKLTRSEARKIAEEYLADKFGHKIDTLQLMEENPYAYNYKIGGVKEQVIYNFNYLKKINGIPFTNYNVSVGIDGTSGKIRNYYSNKLSFDEAKLPSKEGTLTPDAAMEKFKQSVNIGLQYITSYQDRPFGGPSKPKVTLAYVPASYTNMIDAFTGKAINYDGSEFDYSSDPLYLQVENPATLNPGAKLATKAIDEADAKAIAQRYRTAVEQLLGVKFEDNANMGYSKPYYDMVMGEIYNYNWNLNKGGDNYYLNIAINGQTGHVYNMSVGSYNQSKEAPMQDGKPREVSEKISWQAGKEKAIELVKLLAPEQYGFYTDQTVVRPVFSNETLKYMREYNYGFVRVVNGIRYRDNNMNVSIDRETGYLRNFYFNWNDTDFPSADKTIKKDAAAAVYFGGTEAQLSYFLNYTFDKLSGQEKPASAPRLVYSFNNKGMGYGGLIVDAVSGKLVDYSGREVDLSLNQSPELEEHWAKRSVELLIAQGVIKNPYVKYNTELTRAEAVKMLSLAKGMQYYDMNQSANQSFQDITKEDEDFVYIENAVRNRIIIQTGGNFNGSEKITKEEFVKLLTNLMGYSEIAKHSDIFQIEGIKAQSTDAVGSIAVCKALGVLPVEDGKSFEAGSSVTLAEAAVALYKAMSYIR